MGDDLVHSDLENMRVGAGGVEILLGVGSCKVLLVGGDGC